MVVRTHVSPTFHIKPAGYIKSERNSRMMAILDSRARNWFRHGHSMEDMQTTEKLKKKTSWVNTSARSIQWVTHFWWASQLHFNLDFFFLRCQTTTSITKKTSGMLRRGLETQSTRRWKCLIFTDEQTMFRLLNRMRHDVRSTWKCRSYRPHPLAVINVSRCMFYSATHPILPL